MQRTSGALLRSPVEENVAEFRLLALAPDEYEQRRAAAALHRASGGDRSHVVLSRA